MPEYQDFVRGFFWAALYKYWSFYGLMLFFMVLLLLGPVVTGEMISLIGVLFPLGAAALTLATVFPSATESVREISGPARLLFTTRNICAYMGDEQKTVDWSSYQKILETKSDFIVLLQPGIIPLPKRFFRDDDEIETFRAIVRQALGRKAKVKA